MTPLKNLESSVKEVRKIEQELSYVPKQLKKKSATSTLNLENNTVADKLNGIMSSRQNIVN